MNDCVFIKSLGCAQNRFDAQRLQEGLVCAGRTAYHQGRFKDNVLWKDDFEKMVLRKSCCVVFFMCSLCEVTQDYFKKFLGDLTKINPEVEICVSGCSMEHKENFNRSRVNVILGQEKLLSHTVSLCGNTGGQKDSYQLKLIIEKMKSVDPRVILLKRSCQKFCTYCICPQVSEGKTMPFHEVQQQLRHLSEQKFRRIEFGGPCIGDWKDPDAYKVFDDVLALALEEYKFHVEYLEMHPGDITDRTIQLFSHENISKEISIPIQSGSDRILKQMNRGYNSGHIEVVFKKIVDLVPDIEITTDVIIGFPNETNEDVRQTKRFIKKFKKNLKRVDYYSYSSRGTASCKLGDKLRDEILDERFQSYQEIPHACRKLE